MISPPPWITRSGKVSLVMADMPMRYSPAIRTRFAVAGAHVVYCGSFLPVRNGDDVTVVGRYDSNGELLVSFVILPGAHKLYRPHGALLGFFAAIVAAFVGLGCLHTAIMFSFALFLAAALLMVFAVAWVDGERYARRLLKQARQRSI